MSPGWGPWLRGGVTQRESPSGVIEPSATDRTSGGRIEPLDGLRTIAIAFVVLYHVHMPFFTGGFVGVNVFYVLSGYLITGILLRERSTTGHLRLGRFWFRRILRLYPALLAVVIVAGCLWFTLGDYDGGDVDAWTAIILALTYTSNIGRWLFHKSLGVLAQTWSLGMEEQFYLVWPPILAIILRRRTRGVIVVCVLAALVVLSSVLGWVLYAPRGGTATPDIYFSPILNAGPLLMGCLLAIGLRNPRVTDALAGRLGTILTWAGAASLIGIEFSILKGWQGTPATFGVVLPLAGLASMVLVAGLVCRPTPLSRALSFSPVAWFGRNASYSLYIWHPLVFALVLPMVPGLAGKFAAIAASVAVAIASHYAIELPFGKLKDRFEPRGKSQQLAQQVELEPASSGA